MNKDKINQLENLTKEEKKAVLDILNEYSNKGTSDIYQNLIYADYKEIPVDIDTFLHDSIYLGKGLVDDEGRFTVFPYWEKKLKELFPNNLDTTYNNVILTGCLGYDTEIPLLNGKVLKIGELAQLAKTSQLNEYVYAFDIETNKYVPGHLINAFSTGVKKVYKITLDNGEWFTATSNHKFLTRDKHWKSIDSGLSVGDSLMPFYRDYKCVNSIRKDSLYEYVKHPQKDGTFIEEPTHRMVMRYKRGNFKGVVHHKDFNKSNNDPRNLLLTDWNSHKTYHAKKGGEQFRVFNNKVRNNELPQEVIDRINNGRKKGVKARWEKPENHKKASVITRKRMLNGLARKMNSIYWSKLENKEKHIRKIIEYNKDTHNINNFQILKATKIANLAIRDFGELTETTYEQTKLIYGMRTGYPSFNSIMKRISYNELYERAINYNHTITNIEFFGEQEVFDLTVDKYHNFALKCGIVAHNSIGTGKTLFSVVCMLYMLYRMLCLKDPYKHYGLQPIDLITFSFMNITKDAAKGVGWNKCQQLLQSSSWFMERGQVTGSLEPEWHPVGGIELIYGSLPRHVIGRAVFASFEDEISFQPNQDLEKQKEKAKLLVSSIEARMKSRFMKGEKLPTLHILASSKRTDQSFLETWIETKKKNESKTTLIVDEPQWVIRTDKDSPRKFVVAVGNKFLENEVLPLDVREEDLQIYRDKGYQLMYVPMGYYENFLDDLDIALTDIAGISTSNAMNYISGVRWSNVRNNEIKNPFTKEVLEVGNDPKDKTQYYDFFDFSQLPKNMLAKPLYVHLDMSISGDKTGIAGVWIKGKKPQKEGEPPSRELFYRVAFSVAIKAPKGRQISFEKNRQFIYWLREQGLNVKGVSSDSFQSADLGQTLNARGYNYSTISVDRVKDGKCEPYQVFKSAIYEERIEIYPTKLLTEEIIGLVRDGNGKVDHSPAGVNSKDISDATCLGGDTKIFLTSGKHKTIKELYENGYENEYILAYDINTQNIVVEPIENIVYNGKKEIIKLILDNENELICTSDHKILTRDGTYIDAQDSLNVSLMPFNYEQKFMYKNREYTYIYIPKDDKTSDGIYLHKLVAEQYYKEEKTKKELTLQEKEWIVIHHKDINRMNNNPDNLVYVTNVEHSKIHVELNSTPLKRKQLSEASKKRVTSGEHPFCKMPKEQRRMYASVNLTKWNKSEEHRKKTSEKNKELLAKGLHSFQLYKGSAFTKEANEKRLQTCRERYGGFGFSSEVIQQKCRESCLKNNGYDNPWHSKDKQHEIKITKLRNAFKVLSSKYELNNGVMPYIDFKIYCLIEHISVSSLESDIKEACLPIISDNFEKDRKYYEDNIRVVYQFVNRFIKDNGVTEFTLADLREYRDKKIANDSKFKNQFDKSSIRNLDANIILKLGFKLYNHKVVKIEKVGVQDVYDLQLCGIHNFALTCGVFVHNCGAIYNASQHAEEYAYDYGEDLNLIEETNTQSLQTNALKNQMTVDFEQELQRVFNPIANNPVNSNIQQRNIEDEPITFISNDMIIW